MSSGVGPVLTGPLLPGLPSFGLLTLAVLAASGLTALGEIITSRISMLLPPDSTELLLVQVRFGTVPEHDQPGLEMGLTLYAVTSAGKVSVMVVVPLECDGPAFVTVNLYWPLPPAVKTP